MKFDAVCKTDGSGLWSQVEAEVTLTELTVPYVDEEEDFGELRVYFSTRDWDLNKDGLIYTDKRWIAEFREALVAHGFSEEAAKDVDYSEQGMQGDDYVSLDVGEVFLNEWFNKTKE